jgi:diacylglycerol kinase family enzyme
LAVVPGLVLVNPDAGDDDGGVEELSARFAGHEVVECRPDEVGGRARAGAAAGVDFVAVAGGDGTIRGAADVLAGTAVPLLPIPVGTRNHFARDVGVPTIDDAVDAVGGEIRKVDVGQCNGLRFVNNSSIGIYPRIVVRREAHEHRLPKGAASVVAAWEQVRRRGQRVGVTVDGERHRAWLVFVGNGRYGEGLIDLADRETLDGNELDVRVVKADKPLARLRLIAALLVGRLARSPLIERLCTASVDIDVERRDAVDVALDGEVQRLETPLRYRSEPAALSVLVPSRKMADR